MQSLPDPARYLELAERRPQYADSGLCGCLDHVIDDRPIVAEDNERYVHDCRHRNGILVRLNGDEHRRLPAIRKHIGEEVGSINACDLFIIEVLLEYFGMNQF